MSIRHPALLAALPFYGLLLVHLFDRFAFRAAGVPIELMDYATINIAGAVIVGLVLAFFVGCAVFGYTAPSGRALIIFLAQLVFVTIAAIYYRYGDSEGANYYLIVSLLGLLCGVMVAAAVGWCLHRIEQDFYFQIPLSVVGVAFILASTCVAAALGTHSGHGYRHRAVLDSGCGPLVQIFRKATDYLILLEPDPKQFHGDLVRMVPHSYAEKFAIRQASWEERFARARIQGPCLNQRM